MQYGWPLSGVAIARRARKVTRCDPFLPNSSSQVQMRCGKKLFRSKNELAKKPWLHL